MRRATAGLLSLLFLVGVAAASAGQNPPASTDAQSLEAAWAFLRARNVRDYAIVTPNGIDEARFVEVGGMELPDFREWEPDWQLVEAACSTTERCVNSSAVHRRVLLTR